MCRVAPTAGHCRQACVDVREAIRPRNVRRVLRKRRCTTRAIVRGVGVERRTTRGGEISSERLKITYVRRLFPGLLLRLRAYHTGQVLCTPQEEYSPQQESATIIIVVVEYYARA